MSKTEGDAQVELRFFPEVLLSGGDGFLGQPADVSIVVERRPRLIHSYMSIGADADQHHIETTARGNEIVHRVAFTPEIRNCDLPIRVRDVEIPDLVFVQ